jgi:hypothetical protein
MDSRTMWLTASVLTPVCAGIGYVIHVVTKYKRLLRSSRAEQVRPREATPDRRGMGAQSDFISQTFVPSEAHSAEQLKIVRSLSALGSDPAEASARVGIPMDLLNEK